MTTFTCTATVLGEASGGDRQIAFEMSRDPAVTPVDEVVEAFIGKLHATGNLPSADSYELNSAMRNKEKRVIMVIGHLLGPYVQTPFLTMIAY